MEGCIAAGFPQTHSLVKLGVLSPQADALSLRNRGSIDILVEDKFSLCE